MAEVEELRVRIIDSMRLSNESLDMLNKVFEAAEVERDVCIKVIREFKHPLLTITLDGREVLVSEIKRLLAREVKV